MANVPRRFVRTDRHSLQRRLRRSAGERALRQTDRAAQRVITLLSDENLVLVASQSAAEDRIAMDCNVLDLVWDDPRVFNRRNQLARQGVRVERETVNTTYGNHSFSRERLVVIFS